MTSNYLVCALCGAEIRSNKSQCPQCKSWNTLVPVVNATSTDDIELYPLANFQEHEPNALRFHTGPWDICWGEGIAGGSLSLLSGFPGAGKSTLLIQMSEKINWIYLAAEESSEQIYERCERLKRDSRRILIGHPQSVLDVQALLAFQSLPVVLDSLQGLTKKDYQAASDVLDYFKEYAVTRKAPVIVINQVTKTDDFAGPMSNQHAVDTTLTLQKTDVKNQVCLETIKNRYGPSGVEFRMTMTARGLVP